MELTPIARPKRKKPNDDSSDIKSTAVDLCGRIVVIKDLTKPYSVISVLLRGFMLHVKVLVLTIINC